MLERIHDDKGGQKANNVRDEASPEVGSFSIAVKSTGEILKLELIYIIKGFLVAHLLSVKTQEKGQEYAGDNNVAETEHSNVLGEKSLCEDITREDN